MMQKRKRQGKTDYKKRLELLKSGAARLVIRASNKKIMSQVVEYNKGGDKVITSASTGELKEFGWTGATRNIPAGYLLGSLIAKKSKEKKITKVVVDIGRRTPVKKGVVFAVVKGAKDAGLEITADEKAFPDETRIRGEHIQKNTKTTYTKSAHVAMEKIYEEEKSKITGS